MECEEQKQDEFLSGAFIGEVKAIVENSLTTTKVISTREGVIFKIQKADLQKFL